MKIPVSEAGESVTFICKGSGSSLDPDTPTDKKVRKYIGSACVAEKVDLEQLLPGATMKRKDSAGTLELTVPILPSKAVQFCTVCNYTSPGSPGNRNWKPCTVVFTVAAAGSPSPSNPSRAAEATAASLLGVLAIAALATSAL